MNVSGWLKWQFGNFYRDVTFWGLIIVGVACLAAWGGCPAPIPLIMLIIGLGMIAFDSIRTWVRISYAFYKLEQNQLLNELKRQERS